MSSAHNPGKVLDGVSASIVTYRTPSCELSILLQGLVACVNPANIVVVDNSPDDTLRACAESFGVQYVATGKNLGFGAAHNRGYMMFSGRSTYHLLVNPDIICPPESVWELYRFMENNPEVGLVMPRILYPDGSEQRLCKQFPSPLDLFVRRFLGRLGAMFFARILENYELRHVDLSVTREIPCLSGCFMFLRASVLRGVGGFDEQFFMYMEDVDLCRRIGKRSKTVFHPAVSVVHGYAKGSYRNVRHLWFHLTSAFRYFMKWGWLLDSERRRLNTRIAVWKQERVSLPEDLSVSGTAKRQ